MVANMLALEAFDRSHTHKYHTEDLIYISCAVCLRLGLSVLSVSRLVIRWSPRLVYRSELSGVNSRL